MPKRDLVPDEVVEAIAREPEEHQFGCGRDTPRVIYPRDLARDLRACREALNTLAVQVIQQGHAGGNAEPVRTSPWHLQAAVDDAFACLPEPAGKEG